MIWWLVVLVASTVILNRPGFYHERAQKLDTAINARNETLPWTLETRHC